MKCLRHAFPVSIDTIRSSAILVHLFRKYSDFLPGYEGSDSGYVVPRKKEEKIAPDSREGWLEGL